MKSATMASAKVGFIGLGSMGLGMASSLEMLQKILLDSLYVFFFLGLALLVYEIMPSINAIYDFSGRSVILLKFKFLPYTGDSVIRRHFKQSQRVMCPIYFLSYVYRESVIYFHI